jgi:hypothetical protein
MAFFAQMDRRVGVGEGEREHANRVAWLVAI